MIHSNIPTPPLASLNSPSASLFAPPGTSLEALSDTELHAKVRRLTATSHIALADLLTHLGEVEARGIHRERACSSLYTYCVYELRMSEDAAYRRAKAARIVHQHPGLREVIARGELHLTGLLMIAPLLGGALHAEVLARARFRTKRELARLVAELDPKGPVPARITPLGPAGSGRATHSAFVQALAGPVRELPEGDRPADWMQAAQAACSAGAGTGAMEALVCESATGEVGGALPARGVSADGTPEAVAEAEQALAGAPAPGLPSPPRRPLWYEVRFTASQEYVDLLEEAMDLVGGPRSAARTPEIQLRALRELVERLRKRKTGMSAAPARVADSAAPAPQTDSAAPARKPSGAEPAPARATDGAALARGTDGAEAAPARVSHSVAQGPAGEHANESLTETSSSAGSAHCRTIAAAVRREVWLRDGGRCAYVDDRGQRCLETSCLEFHHQEPFALGGATTEDNLELRCRAHNALAAEQDFGLGPGHWS